MATPPKQSKSAQVLSLSESILRTAGANLQINYLLATPNASNVRQVIRNFCAEADDKYLFLYFNSLPYSHWHRNVFKYRMTARFNRLTANELEALGKQFIPFKSALTDVDGERVALVGPLTDLETAEWDTIDWFFNLLHSKRMEGETRLYSIPFSMYRRARLCFHPCLR